MSVVNFQSEGVYTEKNLYKGITSPTRAVKKKLEAVDAFLETTGAPWGRLAPSDGSTLITIEGENLKIDSTVLDFNDGKLTDKAKATIITSLLKAKGIDVGNGLSGATEVQLKNLVKALPLTLVGGPKIVVDKSAITLDSLHILGVKISDIKTGAVGAGTDASVVLKKEDSGIYKVGKGNDLTAGNIEWKEISDVNTISFVTNSAVVSSPIIPTSVAAKGVGLDLLTDQELKDGYTKEAFLRKYSSAAAFFDQFAVDVDDTKKFTQASLDKFQATLKDPKVLGLGFTYKDYLEAKDFIDVSQYDAGKVAEAAKGAGLTGTGPKKEITMNDVKSWANKSSWNDEVWAEFKKFYNLTGDNPVLNSEQLGYLLGRLAHKNDMLNLSKFDAAEMVKDLKAGQSTESAVAKDKAAKSGAASDDKSKQTDGSAITATIDEKTEEIKAKKVGIEKEIAALVAKAMPESKTINNGDKRGSLNDLTTAVASGQDFDPQYPIDWGKDNKSAPVNVKSFTYNDVNYWELDLPMVGGKNTKVYMLAPNQPATAKQGDTPAAASDVQSQKQVAATSPAQAMTQVTQDMFITALTDYTDYTDPAKKDDALKTILAFTEKKDTDVDKLAVLIKAANNNLVLIGNCTAALIAVPPGTSANKLGDLCAKLLAH